MLESVGLTVTYSYIRIGKLNLEIECSTAFCSLMKNTHEFQYIW